VRAPVDYQRSAFTSACDLEAQHFTEPNIESVDKPELDKGDDTH
jgi:hypothetical protein